MKLGLRRAQLFYFKKSIAKSPTSSKLKKKKIRKGKKQKQLL